MQKHTTAESRVTRVGVAVTASVLAVLLALAPRLTVVQSRAFCTPAAQGAAWFLGGAVETLPAGGCAILTGQGPVHVTLACSAFRFFSILLALLAGLSVRYRRYRLLPAVLLGAYAMTLVANSARIICTRIAQFAAEAWLPPRMFAAIHMGTGLVCFMFFLLLTYVSAERMVIRHEKAAA